MWPNETHFYPADHCAFIGCMSYLFVTYLWEKKRFAPQDTPELRKELESGDSFVPALPLWGELGEQFVPAKKPAGKKG